ncbi:hypothetical protein U9M48_002477 [Paspalum notatum var. saurae]|uniref:Protein kinase domain-containing protein n=1 Tax=Paspalum notatum var. saurae TaxID=547442 RepID=A0AAQ3SDI4_PASNO
MVLDFVINPTQPRHLGTADKNVTSCSSTQDESACKSSHSKCWNIKTPLRNGYVCRCLSGYGGNPYLDDGCQGLTICTVAVYINITHYRINMLDGLLLIIYFSSSLFDINECEHVGSYPCYGECINLPGTYRCRCPHGSHGNYSMMGGCVKSSAGLAIGLGVGSAATLLQHLICQRADIGERIIITLQELEKATNNFDKSRELGGGGHGTVYKGILSNPDVVGIKKAKIVIQKEINEFINEVNYRNIVKLLGCCLETEVPLLIYEFISNGTLYKHLHIETPRSISWKDRLRIAVETVRALAYLHTFVATLVVHRDINSPNILLDDNLNEGTHTTVQGTLRYLDPMYHSTGHLTKKSDVYSYGVLLIELLTRKKPTSYISPHGFGLVNHFTSLLPRGNLDEILDPQVAKEGDGEVVDVSLLPTMSVKSIDENDQP